MTHNTGAAMIEKSRVNARLSCDSSTPAFDSL